MKNLPSLMGSKEENRKIKALRKSFLVIALSTFYPCRESLSDLIIVATKRLGEPQILGDLGRPYRLLGVLQK